MCVTCLLLCVCVGGGGCYVRCSVYFCSCGGVDVVVGCMVCDFGLDMS